MSRNLYNYRIGLIRVIDGDTIVADIDLGFGMCVRKRSIRLAGIDAPETRTTSILEKTAGKLVTEVVRKILGQSKVLTIQSREIDKFGRPLARVILDDNVRLDHALLRLGIAHDYNGGTRRGWTDAELHRISKTCKALLEQDVINTSI